MGLRVVFVEPPKTYWFVMGEYLPPPTAALQLAAYLERERPGDDITVVDCQAEGLDWRGLEMRLAGLEPEVVAVSSLATCNAYIVVRALETAKRVAPGALTITVLPSPSFFEIRFDDEGPGIPPDQIARVFEPFYTTKEKGVGMGLAVCSRIVTAHDGTIRAAPREGRGTTVTVRLPAAHRKE